MPELVLKLGDNPIQTYVFDKDIMSVGRAKDNDIVVENLSVSRNHARIRFHNNKYILTDLNSANGSFVNGVRVTKTEIVDGDVIQIGKHKLVFVNKPLDENQIVAEQLGQERTMLVSPGSKPMLLMTEGKGKGTEYIITKFETKIGLAPDCDIVISGDWFLSKTQAVVYRRGDDLYELHDKGSLRKTKVNGEAVEQPRVLKYGDVLEFGTTRCVFQRSNESASPSGRVPTELGNYDSVFGKPGESGVSGMSASSAEPIKPVAVPPPVPIGRQSTDEDESEIMRSMDDIGAYIVAGVDGGAAETGSSTEMPEPSTSLPEPMSETGALQPVGMDSVDVVEAPAPLVAQSGTTPAAVSPTSAGLTPAMAIMAASGASQARPASSHRLPAAPAEATSDVASGPKPLPEFPPLPPDVDPKEVAIWEAQLGNKSLVIRKQAVKMLKKLTGRDYDV